MGTMFQERLADKLRKMFLYRNVVVTTLLETNQITVEFKHQPCHLIVYNFTDTTNRSRCTFEVRHRGQMLRRFLVDSVDEIAQAVNLDQNGNIHIPSHRGWVLTALIDELLNECAHAVAVFLVNTIDSRYMIDFDRTGRRLCHLTLKDTQLSLSYPMDALSGDALSLDLADASCLTKLKRAMGHLFRKDSLYYCIR